MLEKLLFDVQLFGEGGDGGASAATSGSIGAEGVGAETSETESVKFVSSRKGRAANPLENVIYGKAAEDFASPEEGESTTPEMQTRSFEELIKGDYKEDFQKRVQGIINDRFKDYGKLQNTVKSQQTLMDMLADKYGVDGSDLKALTDAIESDESFYENEALQRGLSVKELKEVKRLERENKAFREAQEQREAQEHSNQIYAGWLNEAEELKAKYGIANLDLKEEVSNPDFARLLQSGVTLEAAYKATHFDDMVGGAMVRTAEVTKQKMATNLASRNARPRENGVSSVNAAAFKQNVGDLTKADRSEIARRAARGDIIRF